MKRSKRLIQLPTLTQRIAVTGIAGGGKTVFLTSLLTHLFEHDPSVFPFGKDARVEDYQEKIPSRGYGDPFRFHSYRDRLARQGQWPEKTRDCARYCCEFRRTDWKLRNSRIHFFDFPGERVADAAIAAMPEYAEWSDHLLGHFRDYSAYEEPSRPFLSLLEKEQIEKDELVRGYKETLARLILGYKPLISPSTFLLDMMGRPAAGSSVEELVSQQVAGLPPGDGEEGAREFAPMSPEARERLPDLAAEMRKNYREYRRAVAQPIFRELARSDSLVVLVDISSLLMGGDGRFNDNRQILVDLFEALRPGSTLGAKLLQVLGLRNRALERAAFVAAKSDLVHPADVKNGRLSHLLESMTGRISRMIPEVEFAWFVSSAVVSTRPGKGDHLLIGRPARDNPERAEKEFPVSELPEEWPAEWNGGEFRFTRVYPDVPRNTQIPPKHVGMAQIFDFLTGG